LSTPIVWGLLTITWATLVASGSSAGRKNLVEGIAFGEDTGDPVVLDHQQGTDPLFRHQAASRTHGHFLGGRHQATAIQHVADHPSWHLCLLRIMDT
jgi:hypothetical protein